LWNMRDSDSGLLTREILLLGTPPVNWVLQINDSK
jgi:hypothetical protein